MKRASEDYPRVINIVGAGNVGATVANVLAHNDDLVVSGPLWYVLQMILSELNLQTLAMFCTDDITDGLYY